MTRRPVNRLSARSVQTITKPGYHADGAGLYLRVDANGAKRWAFLFRWRKRRAEMGLGSADIVTLAEARQARDAARRQVQAGKNPIEERRIERDAAPPDTATMTFGQWAAEVAPAIAPKAPKARRAWLHMMEIKVGALADLTPAEIATEHVLAALKPYWVSRPETGRRMRQRIEKVLDAAKAKGLIPDPWQNPARLRGHLENLLERKPKVVAHRTALPYTAVPTFMADLAGEIRLSARALEFAILTAVRSIEVRGARWSEIDRDKKLWTIPAERMKGPEALRREHRVPLSDAALGVLDAVTPPDGSDPDAFIFPCELSRTGMYSENALQNVINDMGLKGRATAHGFRSTFRDWAGDMTNFQRETIEAALAHKIEDDTERAYRRGDALEKRRKLMSAWAGYCMTPATGNVRDIGSRRKPASTPTGR